MTSDPGSAAERGRAASPEAALAAAGLAPDRAVPLLHESGLWRDSGPTEGAGPVVEQLSEAASPEDALLVIAALARTDRARFDAIRADADWFRRFVAVAGTSRPLGDLLARDAAALERLRSDAPVEVEAVAETVECAVRNADENERSAVIAAVRRRETAAIAARDLLGEVDVGTVASELSDLAEGVLSGTLAALGGRDDVRVGVIGMGKVGGHELNYVSDVDVMFVHEPADGGGENTARRAAADLCRSLLVVLNASTPMGRAYEVDATLRPEGRDGPLSRTPASFEAYWERWAETWEFQALLKARPVAGDRELARRLIELAEPHVFPEQLDPGIVADIRDMKSRVEAKREVVRAGERQLKLGPGGLRDIEFSVQLLQLVHGRADRTIRHGGTLPTLEALAARGYVAEDDAETFAAAYRYLRRIEHRLQLADERRTHTLPSAPERLERLARSMGHRATGEQPARDTFLERLRSVQADVRGLHAKLFYRPLLERHASVPATDATMMAPGFDEQAALTRIEALGFRDPTSVLRDIRALTGGLTRRAKTLQTVLPVMLHALSESPDPDGGLRALRTLMESVQGDTTLTSALRDLPPVADLLARLLGTSEIVGELLTNQPQGMSWLVEPSSREEPRSRADLVSRALGVLQWQDDREQRQAVLRRFTRRELTRIIIRDLAGDAPSTTVGRELAALGEACLEAGLRAVFDDLAVDDAPARVAIIAMGKLGGRELHYVSDLDVVFVHEAAPGADPADARTYAVEVAERVLDMLSAVTAEGTAFEVDTELRPEGRSGPLSRSLESCRTYYERWSEVWEHQALLRARHVAGDADLGAAFEDLAERYAYPDDFDERRAVALRKTKARVERERVPRRADASRHLKLGPGGLSDIEWTVQLLQQRHGRGDAVVRSPSTLVALDALQDGGILEVRDARWLRDGYRFLTRTRNRLYLLRVRDVDVLPTSSLVLERLARSLGYGRGGRQTFEDNYLRHTRRVRQITERLFYGQR